MRASGRYQLVGWVRADSPATIVKGLAALAPLLGLPADGAAGEIAARVVACPEVAARLAGDIRQRPDAG